MNHDLEEALAFDGIAEAERRLGKTYHGNDEVVWAGMALAMEQNKTKEALLFLNRDTCSSNTLAQNLAVMEDMGFRQLVCEDIPGTADKWRILWRPGVLVFFDSYWGDKSINGGMAYFNYQGPREALNGCSSGYAGESEGNNIWEGSVDIREGLRHRLDTMAESGALLPAWVKCPFIWLLHYMDTKEDGYDYKAINAQRFAMLPHEVQLAICQTPTP